MGREAAGLILQHLSEKTAPAARTTRQIRLLPELIVRQSSAKRTL
jgi:DNA-binding LacI/PurR family transcriptional regulator